MNGGVEPASQNRPAASSTLPDIIAALLVHTVVGEVHECVLNVLWSPVVLDSGEPVYLCKTRGKKIDFSAIKQHHYKSKMPQWPHPTCLGDQGIEREIALWPYLRGVDATCAVKRIPWHRLFHLNTGTSWDKSRIQNSAVIYGSLLIIKTANRRVVAQCFHHVALSHRTEQPVFHKSSARSRSLVSQQPLFG